MAASPKILQLELWREMFFAKYGLSGPIKWIQSTGEVCQKTSSHLGTMVSPTYHSHPQSPRSFWPVAGLESSGRTRFSEYAQSIRFVFSTNQIWWEVRESRTSGVGPSQSSRALPQARRIVGSGDENAHLSAARWQDSMSRGQKSWNFFNFSHWFFVHFWTRWR